VTAKVAIITGGFGALGRVVARAALAEGYQVAALDFAAPPASGLEPGILPLGGVDLADPGQAAAAVAAVVERLGRIDALFNIAGAFRFETVEEGEVATWDRMHRLNLLTALNTSRAALPHLLAHGAGSIVNVGAGAALKAAAGMGAYAASKAGVHRLTEALAEEWKGRGLTVNAVLPSIIDTPANRADMPKADHSSWVKPTAIAELIVAQLSLSDPINSGALIPVYGKA
jgi:NAD(P)-dependent dehydrogenase (short-subunit alcohol dehydrogenase family)